MFPFKEEMKSEMYSFVILSLCHFILVKEIL